MKDELSSNKDKTIQIAYAQKRKGQSENSQYWHIMSSLSKPTYKAYSEINMHLVNENTN